MIAVWIVMVLTAVGVAGSGFLGCFNTNLSDSSDPRFSQEVLTVDGEPVTLGQIQSQIDAFSSQFGGVSGPDMDFLVTSSVLSATIDQRLMANMASARGISLDESRIVAMRSDEIDASINQFRLQSVQQGALKATATEAEFQQFFKDKNGGSTAELKKKQLDDLSERLKVPAASKALFEQYAMQELQQRFFDSAAVTDEEVKRSYQSLMLLSIDFDNQRYSLEEREAKAARALRDLDAGADFRRVQRKQMKNPVTTPSKRALIDLEKNPLLKPLVDLKPGQHSRVIVEMGLPRIYQLVESKSDLPADFEANKLVYSQTLRREKASTQLQEEVAAAGKKAKVVWKSPGYEAVFKLLELTREPSLSEAQLKERLTQFVNEPVDTTNDLVGPRAAALARYQAMKLLDPKLTVAERKGLLATKVAVLIEALVHYEYVPLRLDLVDAYEGQGDKAKLAAELLMAAQNNSGFDEVNVGYFGQINERLVKFESSGMIAETEALQIRDVLSTWSKDKSDAEAAAKAAQDELDKFNVDPVTGKPLGAPSPTGKGN